MLKQIKKTSSVTYENKKICLIAYEANIYFIHRDITD